MVVVSLLDLLIARRLLTRLYREFQTLSPEFDPLGHYAREIKESYLTV
jgi:hypothetical protein